MKGRPAGSRTAVSGSGSAPFCTMVPALVICVPRTPKGTTVTWATRRLFVAGTSAFSGNGVSSTDFPPSASTLCASSWKSRRRGTVDMLTSRDATHIAPLLRWRFSSIAFRAPVENQWLPRSLLFAPFSIATLRTSVSGPACFGGVANDRECARSEASTFRWNLSNGANVGVFLISAPAASTKTLWFMRASRLPSMRQTCTRIGGLHPVQMTAAAAKSPCATDFFSRLMAATSE
mmetsp:Transcript_68681/g.193769  ORF Transcript_68681/g.193769 Transcript_68681/m.193769 type:complete len:234 (-) Transcript_68681:1538-2239(-)